jgi:vitamin B12 transporter
MRLFVLSLFALALPAQAVIVRGTVTSPLGRPVPGARVQLISLSHGVRSLADTVAGVDGTYEIRTDLSGRFLLLTASTTFAPQIGLDFYAGRTDLLTRNIVLDRQALTQQLTRLGNGLETPLAQLSSPLSQIPPDRLIPRAVIADELPQGPATVLVQTGQQGQPAALWLRGANPEANAVLFDGVQTQNLGGGFNYGTVAATGLAAIATPPAIEVAAGPNPLYAAAAEAGVVAFTTPRASNVRPAFQYSGDGGNLHTWRDEAGLALTRRRADLFAGYSRFDTSNFVPNDRFHVATGALNVGYNISGNTSVRVTGRNEDSAGAMPVPYDLGVAPLTRLADQNLYSTLTVENRTAHDWHNLVRYGLVRKREQAFAYTNPAAGLITVRGANGAVVTGVATLPPLPARQDQISNRDEAIYLTEYPFKEWLSGLFQFRYQNERGLDVVTATPLQPALNAHGSRTNLNFAAALKGEIKHRVFAEASGDLTHSSLNGFVGSPRLGLTYAAVTPGPRRFHGTTLHLTLATGARESSLLEQTQAILVPARSRSLDASVDQQILSRKLNVTAAYFHNQFSHQTELLQLAPLRLAGTQAFRTQGLSTEVRYQPLSRLSLRGGYTYLAALVERSSAVQIGAAQTGLLTPLIGARPFRRPPHSGFFAVQYTGKTVTASLEAALAGRADDSTFTATLLLPNHNLDFGYTKLDANLTYAIVHHVTLFTQLTNLLNDQHIGPIGYPGLPFAVRAGLKLRLGGD